MQISFCPGSSRLPTVFYQQLIKIFCCLSKFHISVILVVFKNLPKKEAFYFTDLVLAAHASGVGSWDKDTRNESFFIA